MTESPTVPELFRDIFKNAYLPYRDPKKDESILDPARGTAGLLISSYKYILKHNTQNYKEQQDREAFDETGVSLGSLTLDGPMHYKGDLLSLDDKKRFAINIRGYDISPDMVRLSLVNMYLHGLASSHIEEYDTLTSDEKWNELADVILANPPFMSPKGGIKPHKRFSVVATRLEVLFVDYIAEHLTPNDRAAVIVPEGIIFQCGKAYKQLRELLVKHYLVAVISLPAGVFNPYSGVKTSILIMGKHLAKKTDAILFAKIENDGYHLGAQRPPIDNLNLVTKAKIVENGEWNLSGERFRCNYIPKITFEIVELGDISIFAIESGGTPKSTEDSYWNGRIYWATLIDLPQQDFISQINKIERTISEVGLSNSSTKVLPVGTVVVSNRVTIGRVDIARIPLATNQGFKNIVIKDKSQAIPEFVAFMMKRIAPDMEVMATDGTFKEISKSAVATLKILLPSLKYRRRSWRRSKDIRTKLKYLKEKLLIKKKSSKLPLKVSGEKSRE
ncbi:type I restriction enzyme M protein [Nitrosomonas aestuarii]|uniref:site-specific DNA-methyltransferase (adenine-specific) n=1 Tax=Nitrosomonas aestuarii TaxID=52441 RepID=A0A1I4EAK2_9PROT|nr:N-6 DNA methylase [Nitrosomonas aestuarii]SFL01406.1 type I restriction enzyme M protein [Nitrosomonas aestuarii]